MSSRQVTQALDGGGRLVYRTDSIDYLTRERMDDQGPILDIAAAILRAKRWLLPRGSRRERWARVLYLPLVRRHVTEPALQRIEPEPHVLMLAGPPIARLPQGGRVLVLKLDHIGDLVVALPALEHLRRALPDAEITLVCGGWNQALARASGLVDHVVVFDFLAARHSGTEASLAALTVDFAGVAAGLGRFGLALDLRHDPDTRPLLTPVDAAVRAGYAAEGVALDLALPDVEHVARDRDVKPLHARTRLVMLVAAAVDAVRPDEQPAERLLLAGAPALPRGPYAVLAPGAGAPLKIWDIARMVELAQALAARHRLRIVVMGGPGDKAMGAQIAAGLPPEAVTDLTGKGALADAPAILAGAALMVGMDSGLGHLAAGLGVPTVSVLSGAPDRDVWRISGRRVMVVAGDATCAPCHLPLPSQCPHGVACLAAVNVVHVLAACDALLATTALAETTPATTTPADGP